MSRRAAEDSFAALRLFQADTNYHGLQPWLSSNAAAARSTATRRRPLVGARFNPARVTRPLAFSCAYRLRLVADHVLQPYAV